MEIRKCRTDPGRSRLGFDIGSLSDELSRLSRERKKSRLAPSDRCTDSAKGSERGVAGTVPIELQGFVAVRNRVNMATWRHDGTQSTGQLIHAGVSPRLSSSCCGK